MGFREFGAGFGLLVFRLALLAATISAVLMVMWTRVHEPYIAEATRTSDTILVEARHAVANSERAVNAVDAKVDELTGKCDAVRARLRDVLESFATIQQRLDAIDSRLYRIERSPGLDARGE